MTPGPAISASGSPGPMATPGAMRTVFAGDFVMAASLSREEAPHHPCGTIRPMSRSDAPHRIEPRIATGAAARARRVKMILMDVDGVLTDGRIVFGGSA